jgi:hypothetical protein
MAQVEKEAGAQFTWHGDSNFFQATFEVPISDLRPGVQFSDMYMQTLAVTNPLGQTGHHALAP